MRRSCIEDGSLPELEAAIKEYGALSEQDEDETDIEAALGTHASGSGKPQQIAASKG
jgi:hypothetical protein